MRPCMARPLLGEAHHDEAVFVEVLPDSVALQNEAWHHEPLLDEALRDEVLLSEALTAMRPHKTRLCMARHC